MRKWKQIGTHKVGAKPIVDGLHRLARAVEMDGTVMAVGFKGGACEENQWEKSRFPAAINTGKYTRECKILKQNSKSAKGWNVSLKQTVAVAESGTSLDALLGYN